ncbi:hypothetical protein NEA10_04210 [Phormidium yuhuli AB48]|uniref:Uncharacterized protein n=1 Tax=Phormidium yuhuli AB48 TaxID=2940671 RepID=A0ABY5ASP7_9CYAN|nr:hypothetical protein [Phormidium yuhuli]USR91936.1 hypothetical protein NEA10_04210 [Phormidium yuhuli AB48]
MPLFQPRDRTATSCPTALIFSGVRNAEQTPRTQTESAVGGRDRSLSFLKRS